MKLANLDATKAAAVLAILATPEQHAVISDLTVTRVGGAALLEAVDACDSLGEALATLAVGSASPGAQADGTRNVYGETPEQARASAAIARSIADAHKRANGRPRDDEAA